MNDIVILFTPSMNMGISKELSFLSVLSKVFSNSCSILALHDQLVHNPFKSINTVPLDPFPNELIAVNESTPVVLHPPKITLLKENLRFSPCRPGSQY